VTVASEGHRSASKEYFEERSLRCEVPIGPLGMYSRAKLCNVLFTRELQRRLKQRAAPGEPHILCFTLHPGCVWSNIWEWPVLLPCLHDYTYAIAGFYSRMLMRTGEEGSADIVMLGSAPATEQLRALAGGYFLNCKPFEPSSLAKDSELSDSLWSRSERIINEVLMNTVDEASRVSLPEL